MRTITINTDGGPINFEPTRNHNTLKMTGAEAALDRMIADYPALGEGRQIDPEHYEVDKEALAQIASNVIYLMANYTG